MDIILGEWKEEICGHMSTTARINIYLVFFTSCIYGISKQTMWRLLSPELSRRYNTHTKYKDTNVVSIAALGSTYH